MTAAPASAHPVQHDELDGHLLGTGAWGDLGEIGRVELTQTEDLVADVAAYGRYAYLANWGESNCAGPEAGGQSSPDAGAWVVDISDPANPRQVNFIAMPQDTRPGEGMQVAHVETSHFKGEILLMNAEACGKNYKGGFMLYDVTNPLKPVTLREGFGDRTRSDAHQTHSAFLWQPTGSSRAYVVTQDSEDLADVDIFDVTNPRRPTLLSELDLNDFGIIQPSLNLADSFHHDVTVKCMASGAYAGKCIMVVSYWDGGYVLLDVSNPAAPVFLYDTDFAAVDPELFSATGLALTPEGNAHQAEFTADNRFFVGSDEDFAPNRIRVTDDDGGVYDAGEFAWTVPTHSLGSAIDGPTMYGGYGCVADRGSIPSASTFALAPGEEAILVVQRGPVGDPSRTDASCFFSEKVETAQLLGYDAVIVANHHAGALEGEAPDFHFCGGQGHQFEVRIAGLCIGHRALHELFDVPHDAAGYTYPEAAPTVGTLGDRIELGHQFDGWGYVHLYDAVTGQELDTFAIPEAMDPAYASGFGDLTVHEVATHPTDPSRLFLSYYSGGVRSLQIQCSNPADNTTCELVETGGYLDSHGNDFWGVEVVANPADDPAVQGDEVLVLGSDRDSGLYVFTP